MAQRRYSRCMPLSLSLPSPWKSSTRPKPGHDGISVSADVIYLDPEEQRDLLARGDSVHENGVTMRKTGSRTPRERVFSNEADRDLYDSAVLFKDSRFARTVEARAPVSDTEQHLPAHGAGDSLHEQVNGSLRKTEASPLDASGSHRSWSEFESAAVRKPEVRAERNKGRSARVRGTRCHHLVYCNNLPSFTCKAQTP